MNNKKLKEENAAMKKQIHMLTHLKHHLFQKIEKLETEVILLSDMPAERRDNHSYHDDFESIGNDGSVKFKLVTNDPDVVRSTDLS